MKKLQCLLIFLFLSQTFAVESFKKRFEIVRNEEGQVVSVKEANLVFNFSIKPYIEFIKESLKYEQALMKEESSYNTNVFELLDVDQVALKEKNDPSSEYVVHIMNSMKQLGELNIDKIFNSSEFQKIIKKFENKLNKELSYLDPTIIAKLDNTRFFYKRNVTYQVVKWGLDLAKKQLSSIPLLNTASYVLVEVERMIREKRLYHQNMLLHYLQVYNERELGLTKLEADHVFSSIYEARIPWYAKWESDAANANWKRYGSDKFYEGFRQASKSLRDNRKSYTSIDERLNYAFQEVSEDDEAQIVNLLNSKAMFNSRPSVAYVKSAPNKVMRKRMMLQLAGLGLSFLPITDVVKSMVTRYIKSYYQEQKITEGALFAHFEITKNVQMQSKLQKQYLNPFDHSLILD